MVEVLSTSSALRDRHTKYNYYEREGVKYYLIIDAEKKITEIYLLVNGKYELQKVTDEQVFVFDFEKDCNGPVDFKEIWVE